MWSSAVHGARWATRGDQAPPGTRQASSRPATEPSRSRLIIWSWLRWASWNDSLSPHQGVDRVGGVLPLLRGAVEVAEPGPVHDLQPGLAHQVVELLGGDEVVALGRVGELLDGADEHEEPDRTAVGHHPPQLGDLRGLVLDGAQHPERPARVVPTAVHRQRRPVADERPQPEEALRRPARALHRVHQRRLDPVRLLHQPRRPADAATAVEQPHARRQPHPVGQPLQRGRAAAAPARRGQGVVGPELLDRVGGPGSHRVELLRLRLLAHAATLPTSQAPTGRAVVPDQDRPNAGRGDPAAPAHPPVRLVVPVFVRRASG